MGNTVRLLYTWETRWGRCIHGKHGGIAVYMGNTVGLLYTWETRWGRCIHGKHGGVAVYMAKGTTSKETMEIGSYGNKLFYGQNPRNLG
jgi:hypothetical protein